MKHTRPDVTNPVLPLRAGPPVPPGSPARPVGYASAALSPMGPATGRVWGRCPMNNDPIMTVMATGRQVTDLTFAVSEFI